MGSGRGATAKEYDRLIVIFFLYFTHTLACPSSVEGERALNAALERGYAVEDGDDGLRRGVHGR